MTNEEWENYYWNVIAPKDFANKIYEQCKKEDEEIMKNCLMRLGIVETC